MIKNKKELIAEYIAALLAKSAKPRNQIAAISGLSNTYITQLEKGSFINVRREKLICFGVALSLNLNEIDDLLNFFDRTPLATEDIETFLLLSNYQIKSKALLPLKDGFPLELFILGAERLYGKQVALGPEPTFCLYPEGFRQYSERLNTTSHVLYRELVEAITSERQRLFHRNLEKSPENSFVQYICKECLEDYLRNSKDPQEKSYRIGHIKMIIAALQKYENFEFFILNQCPALSFTLKQPGKAGQKNNTDRLFIVFWPRHLKHSRRSGRLSGFVTDNDVVIQNFREEIESISQTVIEKFKNRNRLINYLNRLIDTP
jgi:hypothetical protein